MAVLDFERRQYLQKIVISDHMHAVILRHLGHSADGGIARCRSIYIRLNIALSTLFRLWNDVSICNYTEVINTSGFAAMLLLSCQFSHCVKCLPLDMEPTFRFGLTSLSLKIAKPFLLPSIFIPCNLRRLAGIVGYRKLRTQQSARHLSSAYQRHR